MAYNSVTGEYGEPEWLANTQEDPLEADIAAIAVTVAPKPAKSKFERFGWIVVLPLGAYATAVSNGMPWDLGGSQTGVGLFGLVCILGWYFFPTTIAASRKQPNTLAIFVLNLLLGWTLLGWVVAMVWAFAGSKK